MRSSLFYAYAYGRKLVLTLLPMADALRELSKRYSFIELHRLNQAQ